ncbi:MAG: cysteine desulfurase [Magnetococcus sp. DMHC-6]
MIYLDHNATTPVRPEVLAAMYPYFSQHMGNPSSVHAAGRASRKGLDEARRHVAHLLEVHYSQVIFTSGGTEANNLAIFGVAGKKNPNSHPGHVVYSAIEHPSVGQCCALLKERGLEVTCVGVDSLGRVNPLEVQAALRPETILVCVMQANNETGVIQPIKQIAMVCKEAGIPLLVDTVQSVGKIPVNFMELGASMISVSAHKIGGPKGVGALILDKHLALNPLHIGGGHERGRRSGTENVPGIVGFGHAAQLIQDELSVESARLLQLRIRLESTLKAFFPELIIFGEETSRLPNTTALGIPGLDGEAMVMNLDLAGFAVSAGSACSSGKLTPSHVLHAMGVTDELARSCIRISLGWNTTATDIDAVIEAIRQTIYRLRCLASPVALAV